MNQRPDDYLPAAGHDWLLPLYDPLVKIFFPYGELQERILFETQLAPEQRVLDLGCGTGTLLVSLAAAEPKAQLFGIDGDPKALAIARSKIAQAGADIALQEGFSYELPYADGSFDRVLSALVFHHLSRSDKLRSLAEIRRVLAPGGRFVLVDFGPPGNGWERGLQRLVRSEALGDNLRGRLPDFLREAGFAGVQETGRLGTIAGSIRVIRAQRAAA